MKDRSYSDKLVERLASARRVAVLTGAGISAESGIPTFRDPGGLWQQFKPEELANIDAFLANPELVQGWYHHRRVVAEETMPNPGHLALARLEELIGDFTLITQNVDNLHQRAGSGDVVELHGNITRNYCTDCGEPVESPGGGESIARCAVCGGLIRPDVVWFGEMLPTDAFQRAELAARRCDVFLSIGTSAVVYPAAGLPLAAVEDGAYVAEINIEPSAISTYINESIQGRAGEILPRLVAEVESTINERA